VNTVQHHIIHQLRLEIEVGSEDQSFRLRHQLSSYWQEWMVEHMESAFNELSTPDQLLLINRMEVELGAVFYDDFEQQFQLQFSQRFSDELLKHAQGISAKTERKSLDVTDLELLEYFISTGQFPWWAADRSRSLDDVLSGVFVKMPEALKILLTDICNDPIKTRRFVFQFDHQLIIDIVTQLSNTSHIVSFVARFVDKWSNRQAPVPLSERGKRQLLVEVLMEAVHLETKPAQDILQILSNRLAERLNKIVDTSIQIEISQTEHLDLQKDAGYEEEHIALKQMQTVPSEKILTSHAGLILLAPFLPQFFENLDLTRHHVFINQEAKHKAIHLLNYIATGLRTQEEQGLSLEKILCGVELYHPIPRETDLSDIEIAEAGALMKSVLDHWGPLKNTSIEGLRTAFLLREGIVYDKTIQWELRVERKTYDMLLDKIPWGFGHIKFSWTPKPIETAW
jgi:hypothetical protein